MWTEGEKIKKRGKLTEEKMKSWGRQTRARVEPFFVVVGWIYNTARIKFWRYIFSSGTHHIAYFRVHSRASSLYFSRSVLYILAISGTSGSSGLGSQRREQIDNNTERKNVNEISDLGTIRNDVVAYLLKLLVQVTIEILICRDRSTHYC